MATLVHEVAAGRVVARGPSREAAIANALEAFRSERIHMAREEFDALVMLGDFRFEVEPDDH